ncbi:MAG TPA: hypothetical protein PLD91_04870 [Spirochaetota bacterium]|nr:hypothetical protein [Spirochaetota bacterium]
MNRMLSLMILLLACAGFTRCATITYHEKLGDSGSEIWEFEKIDSRDKAYQGTAEERTLIKNKPYYHLQFEGPLAGAGRYLDIYIPHEYNEKIIISESAARMAGTKKAFLLVERYCCSEGYRDIFEQYNVKEVAVPAQVIKKNFNVDVGRKDFPLFFIKLTFSNVKQFYAQHQIWTLKENGKAGVDQGFHMELPYSMMDVRWKERNMAVNGLIKVGYIAPVLADIISSPIQLIGVIIYFAMGGAVK